MFGRRGLSLARVRVLADVRGTGRGHARSRPLASRGPTQRRSGGLRYWTDPAEYVEIVREYGVDLPEWAQDFLEERRVEKEALIEQAIGRAEYREVGDYTVGVTYGRCSQNEVAEAMREAGADASVIVKPAGSASIRGTDEFDRCHEVAGQVNGGGHPKAAGCKPDIYDDMLDYATHWTSRGAVTKRVILEAFRDVVESEDADAGDDNEDDE